MKRWDGGNRETGVSKKFKVDDWLSPIRINSTTEFSMVVRGGVTHVGDDADDGADKHGEEVPGLGGDTRGRGDAPDDHAGEHRVAQWFQLCA